MPNIDRQHIYQVASKKALSIAMHHDITLESPAHRDIRDALLDIAEEGRLRIRELEDKTRSLVDRVQQLKDAIEQAPCVHPGQPTMSPGNYCEHDCDCWKRAALEN